MTGWKRPQQGTASARRRPWLAVLTLGLLSSLLVACGGGSSTSGSASSSASSSSGGGTQDVTVLNILPLASLTFTPDLVADSCGYFKKHGLNVTFQTTQGSPPAIQTVLAGSALLTRIGDLEVMQDNGGKGAGLLAVGTVNRTTTIRFISSKTDPLNSAKDIKGRLMGTPSAGGTSEQLLKLTASSAKIAPADVKTQVVGLAPGVFDLVTSGRIGGYVVSLDTAALLAAQQKDAVVYDPSKAIKSGGQVYVTSADQAKDKQKQDQLRKYMAAISDAISSVQKDEANGFSATMKCLQKYNIAALKDPAVATATLKEYVTSWTKGGLLTTDKQTWQAVYKENVAAGFVPSGKDPSKWFTNDYVPTK
jgi:NitT/TauT family transport system substrate-binding protein